MFPNKDHFDGKLVASTTCILFLLSYACAGISCCRLKWLTNTLNWHYVFRCIGSNIDLMLVVCPLTSSLGVPWEQFNPKRTVHTWHTATTTKTAKEYRLNFIHQSKRRNDDSQSISDRWQTASRILERRHMECSLFTSVSAPYWLDSIDNWICWTLAIRNYK